VRQIFAPFFLLFFVIFCCHFLLSFCFVASRRMFEKKKPCRELKEKWLL